VFTCSFVEVCLHFVNISLAIKIHSRKILTNRPDLSGCAKWRSRRRTSLTHRNLNEQDVPKIQCNPRKPSCDSIVILIQYTVNSEIVHLVIFHFSFSALISQRSTLSYNDLATFYWIINLLIFNITAIFIELSIHLLNDFQYIICYLLSSVFTPGQTTTLSFNDCYLCWIFNY